MHVRTFTQYDMPGAIRELLGCSPSIMWVSGEELRSLIEVGSKHFYLLSHLAGTNYIFLNET